MAMIEMYDTGPLPITEKQLDEAENTTGLKFPPSYRQFMLETNGGMPMSGSFHLKDGSDGSHLDWFYHILPGDDNDLLQCQKDREGRLPSGFLAIATDPYSNEICIDCTPGLAYGAVYFWDHELEADPDQGMTPETADNCYLIADSFPEFLACLYEREIEQNTEPSGALVPNPEKRGILQELTRRKDLETKK